jgi:hypothetical protein
VFQPIVSLKIQSDCSFVQNLAQVLLSQHGLWHAPQIFYFLRLVGVIAKLDVIQLFNRVTTVLVFSCVRSRPKVLGLWLVRCRQLCS